MTGSRLPVTTSASHLEPTLLEKIGSERARWIVKLRIVIVESRAEYADKLEYFITREKGYEVAARFESAQTLLDAAREMAARKAGEWDMILLSLSLPDSAGWSTTQQLRALLPEVPIISYTVLESAENFLRGIRPTS